MRTNQNVVDTNNRKRLRYTGDSEYHKNIQFSNKMENCK
jgi:hypothetical protein